MFPLRSLSRTNLRGSCSACRSFSSTSPSPAPSASRVLPTRPPPPTAHVYLTNRALISLTGHDAPTFLQGLTTANIPALSTMTNGQPKALYSAFLNAQGRILHDVFIYVIKPGDLDIGGKFGDGQTDIQFLIEVDAAEQNALLKWLKRYKLRAKIQLRALDPEEIAVYSSWDESPLLSNSPDPASPSLVHYSDDRAPSFGRRILASLKSSSKHDPTNLGLPSTNESFDLPTYKLRRYLHGIPEGQSELLRESALVQESCLDYMGAVDFRKGCYVGQELVIRTQHIGVVRKRVLPVMIYDGEPPEELKYDPDTGSKVQDAVESMTAGDDIVQATGKGRRVARWMGGIGNIGLALWRLENLEGPSVMGQPERTVGVKPFPPEWWKERKEGIGIGRR